MNLDERSETKCENFLIADSFSHSVQFSSISHDFLNLFTHSKKFIFHEEELIQDAQEIHPPPDQIQLSKSISAEYIFMTINVSKVKKTI
jgi:hypothetical protein